MVVDTAVVTRILQDPELSAAMPALRRCVTAACCNRPAGLNILVAKQTIEGYPASVIQKIKDKLKTDELVLYFPSVNGIRTVKL